jgi:hypothetical protein
MQRFVEILGAAGTYDRQARLDWYRIEAQGRRCRQKFRRGVTAWEVDGLPCTEDQQVKPYNGSRAVGDHRLF